MKSWIGFKQTIRHQRNEIDNSSWQTKIHHMERRAMEWCMQRERNSSFKTQVMMILSVWKTHQSRHSLRSKTLKEWDHLIKSMLRLKSKTAMKMTSYKTMVMSQIKILFIHELNISYLFKHQTLTDCNETTLFPVRLTLNIFLKALVPHWRISFLVIVFLVCIRSSSISNLSWLACFS